MMLIEQSVAPLQFVRLEQSHLQAVQDNLILGAGHPKFFAHAPKLEKSEGACPAKRVYAFPLNYLHSVMDWRCKQRQQLGKQPFHPEVSVRQAVREFDAHLPLENIKTQAQLADRSDDSSWVICGS